MKAKRFWYGLGRSIPVIGFGCWKIAGKHDVDGRPNGWGDIDEKLARELISKALDDGVRFFDTLCKAYGNGHACQRILEFLLSFKL